MAGKIGYNNLAQSSTVTSTTEATGFEDDNAANWNLYDSWKGTHATANTINFDLGSTKPVDYFSLFGHDIIDYAGFITFQWSNDGSTGWTDLIGTVTPTDKAAIFKTFSSVTKRYFRIVVGSLGGAPALSVVSFGVHLELSKGWRQGFSPMGLRDDAMLIQNVSEDGIPLGHSTIVKPKKYTISQTNVTEAWVRSDWEPFLEAVKSQPFFVLWDETNFPLEAVFAWVQHPVSDKATITDNANRFMSVSVPIMGLHEL